MNFISHHTKFFVILLIVTFCVLIIASIVGNYFEHRLTDPVLIAKLTYSFKLGFFILAIIIAFAVTPLIPTVIIKFLSSAQENGTQLSPFMESIIKNREIVISVFTYVVWSIFVIGMVIVFSIQGNILKIK